MLLFRGRERTGTNGIVLRCGWEAKANVSIVQMLANIRITALVILNIRRPVKPLIKNKPDIDQAPVIYGILKHSKSSHGCVTVSRSCFIYSRVHRRTFKDLVCNAG